MVGTTKLVERNRKEMIDVIPVVRAQRENLLKNNWLVLCAICKFY